MRPLECVDQAPGVVLEGAPDVLEADVRTPSGLRRSGWLADSVAGLGPTREPVGDRDHYPIEKERDQAQQDDEGEHPVDD